MNEELLIQKLDNLIAKVEEIKQDSKAIKDDISNIKVKQENLSVNISWIKVLFPVAFALIIFLLGILIKLAI